MWPLASAVQQAVALDQKIFQVELNQIAFQQEAETGRRAKCPFPVTPDARP